MSTPPPNQARRVWPLPPLPSWYDDMAKTWQSETEHRALLFLVLRMMSSATKGWSAYRTLRMMVQPSAIPLVHLHRLASLLAATKACITPRCDQASHKDSLPELAIS